MLDYTYKELSDAIRGSLMVPTRRKRFKGSVCLDTRHIKKGDLFIAIKGKNYDGHNYIDEAFAKGARMAIAELNSKRQIKRKDPDILFVENTLQALGRLAAFHRRQKRIPVIAITGSCGKTTTKDLLAHLLSTKYKVLKNSGSENNFIGVPKTLLDLDDHDIAVVELGTNQSGEIRHLTRLVDPDLGILTLIGNAHLMGFRSIQGVKREKLSMVDALSENAKMVINGDDKNIVHPRFKKMKVIRCGFSLKHNVSASDIDLEDNGVVFKLNGKETISVPLMGRHNVTNSLLAIAAAQEYKLKPRKWQGLFASFEPPKGRVRYQEVNLIHWIDDSYNSNPSSLSAAIALFKEYPPKGRKILVVGDMLELGQRAAAFHREAGRDIADHDLDLVLTVGSLSKRFAEEAVFHGFPKAKLKTFDSSEKAGQFLKDKLRDNDTVLLKGSRGMHMERIMQKCGVEVGGE